MLGTILKARKTVLLAEGRGEKEGGGGGGEESEGKRKEKRLPTKPMRLSNTPKLVALDLFYSNILYSQ